MRAAYLASGLLLLAGAAVLAQRALEQSEEQGGDLVPDAIEAAAQEAAEFIDTFTGGAMKISAMANVTAGQIAHPNVQAFLRVIRRGEGTADDAGYRRMFGGELFTSFADHPRKLIKKGGYTSTAAGAYQALISSWDETKRIMGLADFSPRSQDRFAVGRIAARGALADVMAGRFEVAIRKCAKEWASLPFSPYGQPTISLATATDVYTKSGGIVAA